MGNLKSKNDVIIDSDFFNCFTMLKDSNGNKHNTEEYFVKMMEALNLHPLMSEYVYNNELNRRDSFVNTVAVELVKAGYIQIVKFDDLWTDEVDLEFYDIAFEELYNDMRGNRIHLNGHAKDFNASLNDLGEIHSCLLAKKLKIPYLYSNDKRAKKILTQKVRVGFPEFQIYNVGDVFEIYADEIEKEEKSIPYSKFKQYFKNKIKNEHFAKINEIWHR